MQTGSFDKFDGGIEVDETYIGGKARNMHRHVRARKIRHGRGPGGKAVVAGVLQRGGRVRATVIDTPSQDVMHKHISDHVEPGTSVYTDTHGSYAGLEGYDLARSITPSCYVDAHVHTNGIENF